MCWHTKTWPTVVLAAAGLICAAATHTNGEPVKVAIITADKAQEPAADLLAIELSRWTNVALLERSEIKKVLSEQQLTASNERDSVKLGRLLAADGLLVLELQPRNGTNVLTAELIAVKPGVGLADEAVSWPIPENLEWCHQLASRFAALFPKLTVLEKDAVPISVLNLRSATSTRESRELEHELTLMLIQRLTCERELFVLERRHMGELLFERDLKPGEESPFWTGRSLIDGALDKNGFDRNQVTVSIRLISTQGGTPVSIEISGPRDNPAAVVESLAARILEALKREPSVTDWRPLEEADKFFEEAKWAYRWALWNEAESASESAWALGKQNMEVAALRLDSYLKDASPFTTYGPPRYTERTPNPAKLKLVIHALELFNEDMRLLTADAGWSNLISITYTAEFHDWNSEVTNRVTRAFATHTQWFDLGIRALNVAGAVLYDFNQLVEARTGNESRLAELRGLARQTESALEANIPSNRGVNGIVSGYTLNTLKWEDGGLWFETPEDALLMYAHMLATGFRPSTIPRPSGDHRDYRNVPQIVGWSWESRRRIPLLLKQLAESLIVSTNQDLQLEGLFYRLVFAPYDLSGRLDGAQNELYGRIWEQRHSIFKGGIEASILECVEETLGNKYGSQFNNESRFHDFRRQLRKDYLTNALELNEVGFRSVFSSDYTDSELGELRPLFEEFKRRLNLSSRDTSRVNFWWGIFTGHNEVAEARNNIRTLVEQSSSPVITPIITEFKKWNLDMPQMNPDLRPIVQTGLFRGGRLWFQIQCCNVRLDHSAYRTVFAVLNLETGSSEVIPFPPEFGLPGSSFEVTGDSLYVAQRDKLQRYRFQTKKWETIRVPLEGNVQITGLSGRFYLTTSNTVLEVEPSTQKIEILASSRRQPALNSLDEIGQFKSLPSGLIGKLVIFANDRFFTFSPDRREWSELSIPLSKTFFRRIQSIPSDEGLIILETSSVDRTHLFAFWNDDSELKLLLNAPGISTRNTDSPLLAKLSPAQWNWPQPYHPPATLFVSDGKNFWGLQPNKTTLVNSRTQTLSFDDDRNATVFRFEPEFQQAMLVPILFKKGGRQFEPFDPTNMVSFQFPNPERPGYWSGAGVQAFDTPQGLVVIHPEFLGCWLIPHASLESRLEILRRPLREQSPVSEAKKPEEQTRLVHRSSALEKSAEFQR